MAGALAVHRSEKWRIENINGNGTCQGLCCEHPGDRPLHLSSLGDEAFGLNL